MKQHKSTWQRHERHVAAAMGATRTGNTGQPGADVQSDAWSIECKSWRRLPARVLDALQLFTRLVNIGDAKSLATHPASTTHRQLNPEELAKAGVSEDMLRLSVGIEHIDDLREDLEQALNAA